MTSAKVDTKTARRAGGLYILAGLTGAFGIVAVPGILVARGDAAATAERILGSGWLFRLGLAGELISAVGLIFLVRALQRLFKQTDEQLASLMVTFIVISVPISFVNALNGLAALGLLSGPTVVSGFDKVQLDALASAFLGLHSQGFVINGFFWGLWLLPLGVLVMRSGLAPRILGLLVILAGVAYVINSASSVLSLPLREITSSGAVLVEAVGEVSMIVWLLITGAKARPLDELFDRH
jgi:Domain of unknown function (DUF4386)